MKTLLWSFAPFALVTLAVVGLLATAATVRARL